MEADEEVIARLVGHVRFDWRSGMLTGDGVRVGDASPGASAWPDLFDAATAGVLLGELLALGVLTDVVVQEGEVIVAVDLGDGVQGYAAGCLGEAAAWALLAAWDDSVKGAPEA